MPDPTNATPMTNTLFSKVVLVKIINTAAPIRQAIMTQFFVFFITISFNFPVNDMSFNVIRQKVCYNYPAVVPVAQLDRASAS